MKDFIRQWKEVDLKEIEQSLIVVGELQAECYSCHEIGIDKKAIQCPKCGAYFKYMGFRRKLQVSYLRQMVEAFPYLNLIDFDDFKKSIGKRDARKLLDF
tara:strand:- start:1042 stop:1341 length:300 start_codon:yes stop_codon:yes gene_type:complete